MCYRLNWHSNWYTHNTIRAIVTCIVTGPGGAVVYSKHKNNKWNQTIESNSHTNSIRYTLRRWTKRIHQMKENSEKRIVIVLPLFHLNIAGGIMRRISQYGIRSIFIYMNFGHVLWLSLSLSLVSFSDRFETETGKEQQEWIRWTKWM